MRKRFNELICILCMLCFCTQLYGHTFYIDALSGSDNNSGYSPQQAWKTLRQVNITTFEPGDTILFRSGQTWEGMLFPRGSGAEGRPIVISKYGGDKFPKIHGGHSDPVVFEGHRTIQTVLLQNQQYWVISNLEITNMPENILEDFVDNGEEKRRGIYVVASDTGELRGITICNNYVHHVKGDDTKDFHGSGGIMVAVIGKTKSSFFNGVHILNNRVYMVNRTGIGVSSRWQRRPRNKTYPYSWMDEMGCYQANLNVVISGNDLESIGGDGIVPQTSFKALMEYNKVNGAASRSNGHNAGLWAWNSDSVLIQYNEVCNTQTIRDGMAFDCDAYSTGNIYQYNYSYNNMGGFMLLFGYSDDVPDASNVGHIIRYNMSVNDGNALLHFYGSGHTQSVIHNNLFFSTIPNVSPVKVEGKPLDVVIRNNIFQVADMGKWIGTKLITRFYFSDNILWKANRHVPKRWNNKRKTPTLADLQQLFGHEGNLIQASITPESIRQMWDSLLQKHPGYLAEQQYSLQR